MAKEPAAVAMSEVSAVHEALQQEMMQFGANPAATVQ